jgi:hypothetical protein
VDRTFIPTKAPQIQRMHALALKRIFEKPAMTPYEEAELDIGVDFWSNKPDISPYERAETLRIVNALIANEEGYFYRTKFLLKMHKIDYHKLFRAGLPYIKCQPAGLS